MGVRQSRYFGRVKTRFQLFLAATVANLTLVATRMGMMSQAPGSSYDRPGQRTAGSSMIIAWFILATASWIALGLSSARWLSLDPSRHSRGFQPDF